MSRFAMTLPFMFVLGVAQARVAGQCEHQGRTAAFVDGAAWAVVDEDSGKPTGEQLLVFSTYALDTDAIWRTQPRKREAALRDQDAPAADSARLQLTLDPDGAIVTQQYLWLSPGNNLSRSGNEIGVYAPGKAVAGRVAGRYRFSDEPDDPRCELTFDLPLLGDVASAPLPPGKPLPAGGGEPGRAYLAGNQALLAGDLDALAKLLPAGKAADMANARQQPDFAAQLAFVQALVPRGVRITGGRQDGDRAWLEFTATEDGKSRVGTAEMQRLDGRWFVVRESTRDPD